MCILFQLTILILLILVWRLIFRFDLYIYGSSFSWKFEIRQPNYRNRCKIYKYSYNICSYLVGEYLQYMWFKVKSILDLMWPSLLYGFSFYHETMVIENQWIARLYAPRKKAPLHKVEILTISVYRLPRKLISDNLLIRVASFIVGQISFLLSISFILCLFCIVVVIRVTQSET